ncbi:MAG: bifunctional diaminohydroxyphosphoribosylaminopyrimidine deaminase/5-amino-6-(5-phosphoribosylamino)uracil reductase RibD [Candidatus Zixiibacteriota bacterium]
MADTGDREYMQLALDLAERGRGRTAPNPMVGAVIVRGGRIVGKGYHKQAGQAHSEIIALKEAGPAARGATLYVNLEPCCHIGRTGPCTEAIIRSGVSRVCYAHRDPDPRVNGRGARILRKAGLVVHAGLLREEGYRLNDAHIEYHRQGRPFVIAKSAQTLDGRIAADGGDSSWITSPQSRKFAHKLRAEVDAVCVGRRTLTADNPKLTVRLVKGRNPYRIILCGDSRIVGTPHVVKHNGDARTIIAAPRKTVDRLSKRWRGSKLVFWTISADSAGRVDPVRFIEVANEFGIRSILLEGGASILSAFLRAKLVDKYIAISAPMLLGSGLCSIAGLKKKKVADGIRLKSAVMQPCGPDFIVTGYPVKG